MTDTSVEPEFSFEDSVWVTIPWAAEPAVLRVDAAGIGRFYYTEGLETEESEQDQIRRNLTPIFPVRGTV